MEKEKNIRVDSDTDIFDDSKEKYILNKRFLIKKKIGKGGMGEIFLAEDTKLKRLVAIKSISKENLSDKDSKIRFLREAQTASQIEHPNICPIYEIYEEEKNNFIVMQYIDGVTLDSIIRYNDLDLKKILNISIQICEGMIEAHSIGIIHRDLKPGNVMVDKKGNVKLLDFGLAKFRDDSDTKKHGISNSNLTEKGIVIGTVSYMSPEQARGEPLDFRNDIFSFGIMLFEMYEGYNPFYDKEQITTLYNVLNSEVIFKNNSDPNLEKIIKKCLKKKREDRFSSFEEIKEELLKVKSGLTDGNIKESESGKTEIIDLHEKEEIMKEIEKSTSIDDLGDIVYRIKKIKTETVPVMSTKRSFFGKHLLLFLIPLLIAVVLFLNFLFKSPGGSVYEKSIQYIVLHPLEGKTSKRFKDEIYFLMKEGFENINNIKIINNKTLSFLEKSDKKSENDNNLRKKFNIKYGLRVKITAVKNIYTFDATLETIDKSKRSSITVPGLDSKDSILTFQVKTLIKRVVKKIFPGMDRNKLDAGIVSTYGNSWKNFDIFFRGVEYFKKINIPMAKRNFLLSKNVPAVSYYLANLLYFNGDRIRSKKIIEGFLSETGKINMITRLKTLALKARLDLNFSEEIKYLMKLKNLNPLSKESFYELGEAFFHRGDAVNALKYYSGAINLDRDFSMALNHMGYCYSYLGNHEKAIEYFEAYRDHDKSANSFDSLGDGYFYAGDLLSAEASKLTALKIEEKGVYWAYLTLSDIYLLKNRMKDSLDACDKYLSVVSEPYERSGGLSKKAFVNFYNGNLKKALKFINMSLSVYDSEDIINNSAEEHWLKGLILLKSGNRSGAKNELQWLENIVKQNNLSHQNYLAPLKYMYHLRSLINIASGNLSGADENFISLVSLKYKLSYWITQYNYQFFLTEYSRFLFNLKRGDKALEQINKCLALGDRYIPALWLKAEILESMEQHNESMEIYKEIDVLYDSKRDNNGKSSVLRDKLGKYSEL